MTTSSQIAFNPQGKTVVVAAAAIAPLGVQVSSDQNGSQPSSGQYRLVNAGTTTVFLGVGSTAATAQLNAVAPVAGSPSPAIVLVPGAVEVLSFGDAAYFSGLSAVAATVYITPGAGV
jgi:hypothetical protein